MVNEVRAFSIELLRNLTEYAMKNNQVIGEENDYYFTLSQLEAVLKKLLEKYGRWTGTKTIKPCW